MGSAGRIGRYARSGACYGYRSGTDVSKTGSPESAYPYSYADDDPWIAHDPWIYVDDPDPSSSSGPSSS